MTPPIPTPRLYGLTAKEAPIVVVLRRGPSKRYHIIKINTQTSEIERGSWFKGRLYGDDCDLSFDGEWLIYKALGATGAVWTGLCRVPWLKTYREWANVGTWDGGGFFASRTLLHIHVGSTMKVTQATPLPFLCRQDDITYEQQGKLISADPRTARMMREGWYRPATSQEHKLPVKGVYSSFHDHTEWICQPSASHPRLHMIRRRNLGGIHAHFALDPSLPLFDEAVEWANWDALGQLIVARQGLIYKYTLGDLASGQPSMTWDLRLFDYRLMLGK